MLDLQIKPRRIGVLRMMKFFRISTYKLPAIGAIYLCGYVLLERITNVQPVAGLGIAPWCPFTGLSFLLILLYGRRMTPLLFLAPFLAELINPGFGLPAGSATVEAAVIGGGYTATALALLRPELKFSTELTSQRDVFILLITVIVSTAIVAFILVSGVLAAHLLHTADFTPALLQYWVGELSGIAVVVPLGLLLARERFVISNRWAVLQATLIAVTLAIAVGSARNQQLHLFFLLFLPITWIAVSGGLEGVSVALLLTQIGLITAFQLSDEPMTNITALQARMAVLAGTGIIVGALVAETKRAERKLRENQAAIARLSRLGSMGELAIAIAHELNQPLSAAGTYSRLVAESLAEETLKDENLIDLAKKATTQVERAALVVKRLRTLVRAGRSELSPIAVDKIVQESLDLVRPILERNNIVISLHVDETLPDVLADKVQIGLVLINLLRNAAEAITSAAMREGGISLRATKDAEERFAKISVSDTGPGFSSEFMQTAPVLFSSSKTEGLGVGLSLCRSIIETHGGDFRMETSAQGACVSFTLPFAKVAPHDK
jgi:two-component system, LuxR family, sensor kinase FixL